MEVEAASVVLLCGAAFLAGAVDAIAGGGGLLTLPVLLWAGLSPHQALGTNKGQSVFGAAAAVTQYQRARLIDLRLARFTFPVGLLGAFLGALGVSRLSPALLRPLILILLLGAGLVLATRRSFSPPREKPLPGQTGRMALFAFAIAAYDGFFGPGTGTFLVMGFTLFFQLGMAQATADAKVVNLASNLAALAWFSQAGWVQWSVALPMAAAQFAGAYWGAHLAVQGGERIIRKVLLGVVVLLVWKIGWELFFAAPMR
jgi:hypothetical protein